MADLTVNVLVGDLTMNLIYISLKFGLVLKCKGRARYRPIDDRARYWANFFFWTRLGKLKLENFQRKKKKGHCRD